MKVTQIPRRNNHVAPARRTDKVTANVRALFARHNVSAARVSDVLGWSQAYMSRRMSGKTAWDIEDLDAIALMFEVPLESLTADPPQYLSRLGESNPRPFHY
uniref:helix-turn-helix domain-containing protein n=1 Tax=Nocardia sp. A7 TaxID=2789274 RepID=UPI00397CE477